jgi:uncharacterized protein
MTRPLLRPRTAHFARAAAAMALSWITVTSTSATAQECRGKNMLKELEANEPLVFAEIRKAANATENAKHLLWKIEDPKEPDRAPSYLFGTIHLSDPRAVDFPKSVTDALASVHRVATEVDDPSSERVSEAMATMTNKGVVLLPGQDRLDKMLTAPEHQRAALALKRLGMAPDMMARVKPWVASMLLATSDCERSRAAGGKLTVDSEIVQRAEGRGLGAFGLETLETQFQSMADVPDADQLALLKAQLALQPRINDVTETLLQLYLDRDLGAIWPFQIALAKAAGVDPKVFESYQENLIYLRNQRMLGRVHTHLFRGGVFMAVGALHLPGKTGLVSLLREMELTVTPVH